MAWMNSFETDRKRWQKMWDKGQSNDLKVDNAQQLLSDVDKQALDLMPSDFVVNYINSLGGDYIDITSFMTNPYQVSGFVWKISKTMPESWVQRIRAEILYNLSGAASASFTNMAVYQNINLALTVPDPSSPDIVTATWNIGFYIVSYDPTVIIPTFQAKLNFTFVPPSLAE
jgi:hypothetical protein